MVGAAYLDERGETEEGGRSMASKASSRTSLGPWRPCEIWNGRGIGLGLRLRSWIGSGRRERRRGWGRRRRPGGRRRGWGRGGHRPGWGWGRRRLVGDLGESGERRRRRSGWRMGLGLSSPPALCWLGFSHLSSFQRFSFSRPRTSALS